MTINNKVNNNILCERIKNTLGGYFEFTVEGTLIDLSQKYVSINNQFFPIVDNKIHVDTDGTIRNRIYVEGILKPVFQKTSNGNQVLVYNTIPVIIHGLSSPREMFKGEDEQCIIAPYHES